MDKLTSPASVTFSNGSQMMDNASISPSCNWSDASLDTTYQSPAIYFEFVMYPILLIICTLGNGLNLVVLFTDRDKSTTNVYMICLAISDFIILWIQLPIFITEIHPEILNNTAFLNSTLNMWGLQKWIDETCVQFSDWTLIVFSVERLLVISKPLQLRNWIRVRNAVAVEILVLVLAAVFAIENLVTYYVMRANDDGVSSMADIIGPALVNWDQLQNRAEVVITITKWVVIVLINIILITILSRHEHPHSSGLRGNQDARSSNIRNSHRILLACVCMYTISQLPNVIYKCLLIATDLPYCSYHFTVIAQHTSRPIIYIFLLMNYSLNFFLYCGVCRKFRNQLRSVPSSMACSSQSTETTAGNSSGRKESVQGMVPLDFLGPVDMHPGKRGSDATILSFLHSRRPSDDATGLPKFPCYDEKLVKADLSRSSTPEINNVLHQETSNP